MWEAIGARRADESSYQQNQEIQRGAPLVRFPSIPTFEPEVNATR
jgi:hypothetical protein